MPTRNVNLLLSNAAQPANGTATGNVIQWYGGPLSLVAQGVFAGATVDIMIGTRYPSGGSRLDYADPAKYTDADWTVLHTFNAPGQFNLANLNPCALVVRVNGSAAGTRVRVQAH